jgi:predicted Zn-dependent protease
MRLQFAKGWLELGCDGEALAELDRLDPSASLSSDALEIRFHLSVRGRRLDQALALARQHRERFPEDIRGLMNLGNSLFWLDRPKEAIDLVLPATRQHPSEAILHYNLACYLLKVDEPDAAKESLRKAIRLGDAGRIIRYALEDADLEPVWPWLRSLPKDKVSGA